MLSRARVKSCQEARHQVTRALNDALDLDFKIGFNASLFHASRGIESPAKKKHDRCKAEGLLNESALGIHALHLAQCEVAQRPAEQGRRALRCVCMVLYGIV